MTQFGYPSQSTGPFAKKYEPSALGKRCAELRDELATLTGQITAVKKEVEDWLRLRDVIVLPDVPRAIADIFHAASIAFSVSIVDMRGAGRNAEFVAARRYAVERLRDELGLSYPHIGKLLGRDHTSIMNLYQTRSQWRDWLKVRGVTTAIPKRADERG